MKRGAPSRRENRSPSTGRTDERRTASGPGSGTRTAEALHRVRGNQAVKRLHEGGGLEGGRPPRSTSSLCPRCVRRFRAGKAIDCGDCERSLADAESTRQTDKPGGAEADEPELTASDPGDRYEREADQVARDVMGMASAQSTTHGVDRIQQRDADGNAPTVRGEAKRRIESLRGRGRPLSQSARSFFEPRFGRDFGDVRVHTGPAADEAARAINAEAFTYGRNVAFRSGKYDPEGRSGRRLLAHELTHVVQQNADGGREAVGVTAAGAATGPVQRQAVQDRTEELEESAESTIENPQEDPKCNIPSECPDAFCSPFWSEEYARYVRAQTASTLLAGIAAAVTPRVVPVWNDYLWGGAAGQRDYSDRFGTAFETSERTRRVTDDMKFRITHTLANNPPAVPENDSVTLSLEDHIEGFIDHLPAVMNFNFPEEIPGNIAGGVGTDQQDCPVGANPSRFDDVRTADGTLEVTRDESGTLHVEPDVTYTVEDTVDLCPGNCGGMMEWLATVLLSRFEATGISGDVPFEVSFPAPMDPFTVTPVGPSPDPAEGTDGGASPSDGTDGGASDGTGGGPSKTSTYEVQQGDTLWEIAKSEYGDPTKWEKIASENGIDDPRQLRVGTVLDIPPA